MNKITDFLLSKHPIAIALKCAIALILLIAICNNPYSRMGKGFLVFLTIAIPINFIAQLIIYVSLTALFYFALHSMVRERSKLRRMICYVICFVLSIFIFLLLITDNYNGVASSSIPEDFEQWSDAIYDLANDDTNVYNDAEIQVLHMPGYTHHSPHGGSSNPTKFYVHVYQNDYKVDSFALARSDYYDLIEMNEKYETFKIEYYSGSHYIKSIEPIKSSVRSEQAPENTDAETTEPPPIPEGIEIWLEESYDDNMLWVKRPEISEYDDYNENISDDEYKQKLYWYVTKNGEYYECFEANKHSSGFSISFLIAGKEGKYTVTLVINYDEETGEYLPVSNTLNIDMISFDPVDNKWTYEIS